MKTMTRRQLSITIITGMVFASLVLSSAPASSIFLADKSAKVISGVPYDLESAPWQIERIYNHFKGSNKHSGYERTDAETTLQRINDTV